APCRPIGTTPFGTRPSPPTTLDRPVSQPLVLRSLTTTSGNLVRLASGSPCRDATKRFSDISERGLVNHRAVHRAHDNEEAGGQGRGRHGRVEGDRGGDCPAPGVRGGGSNGGNPRSRHHRERLPEAGGGANPAGPHRPAAGHRPRGGLPGLRG